MIIIQFSVGFKEGRSEKNPVPILQEIRQALQNPTFITNIMNEVQNAASTAYKEVQEEKKLDQPTTTENKTQTKESKDGVKKDSPEIKQT